MSRRLDLLLALLAMMFLGQLQWRPLPDRWFQALAGAVMAFYFWQLILTYRLHPEGEPEAGPWSRWALILALLTFFVYVAIRFMWAAAG